KPGAWTPVFVDLTAGPQGLENATLTVESTDNDDIQNIYTVPLPRLDPKEYFQAITYTKPGSGGGDIVITIYDKDKNQLAKNTRNFSNLDHLNLNELLYLTAGSRLPGLRRLANTISEESQKANTPHNQFYQPRAAYVDDADQLPMRWFGYDSVD